MFENTTERERKKEERSKDWWRILKLKLECICCALVIIIFSKVEFKRFIFIFIRREWFFSLTRFTVDFENWVNESIIIWKKKKKDNGSSRSRAASNIIRSPFLIQLIGTWYLSLAMINKFFVVFSDVFVKGMKDDS